MHDKGAIGGLPDSESRSSLPDKSNTSYLIPVATVFFQRLLLIAAILFIAVFVVVERRGLASMISFILTAVVDSPSFINDIASYFGSVPGAQLWPSLLVGAVFGIFTTGVAYVARNSERNLNVLLSRQALTICAAGGLIGTAGSQILMYPTQHCTYAPEATTAEFRLGLIVTVFGSLLALVPVWTLWLRRRETQKIDAERLPGSFRGYTVPIIFLLPTLMMLGLFLYYPAAQILHLSLFRKIARLPQERFSCLGNYVALASDVPYRNSFLTTFFITAFIVAFSLSISLGIALLATQKIRGRGIYRTLLIWPYAVSPVVTGIVFLSMFREGGSGLINAGLQDVFGISPRWLTDQQLAPWVIILASVWNMLGFNILFYIAGLQNIPGDLLEAASLDGATWIQRFWKVTLPLLSPFTFFLLVTNITFSFYGIYGVVDTLTRGGPPLGPAGSEGGATNILIYKLYRDAFSAGAPAGMAAAQAVILFLMVAAITIMQFRYIERRVTYGG